MVIFETPTNVMFPTSFPGSFKTANKVADVDDIAKSFANLNCLDISLLKFNAPSPVFFSLTALVFNLKLVSNVLDIRVRFELIGLCHALFNN